MEVTRKRSYSFEAPHAELAEESFSQVETEPIPQKRRRKAFAVVYTEEQSWASRFCLSSACTWKRRFLVVTQNKLVLCGQPNRPYGTAFPLRTLRLRVSKNSGHQDKYLCLELTDSKRVVTVSFESREDLEVWYAACYQDDE